jgi:very-short-patch-repair endonuclease
MILAYNTKLKDRSRKLRNQSTLSEVLLWNEIKARKLGFQFFRQKPIGNYIVDFYCPKLRLIIEIDGSSHNSKQEYDKLRDGYFNETKLRLLKFLDSDVKNNLDSVVRAIKEEIIVCNPPCKGGVPKRS